jgi:hypothetical protein
MSLSEALIIIPMWKVKRLKQIREALLMTIKALGKTLISTE